MNLSKFSMAELKKLQKRVEHAIEKKHIAETKAARKQVEKLLSKHGLTVNDIVSSKSSAKSVAVKTRKSPGKVKPKYANPEDKKVTWTGRGRKPLWVQAHLDKGGKLEELAI